MCVDCGMSFPQWHFCKSKTIPRETNSYEIIETRWTENHPEIFNLYYFGFVCLFAVVAAAARRSLSLIKYLKNYFVSRRKFITDSNQIVWCNWNLDKERNNKKSAVCEAQLNKPPLIVSSIQ